MDPEQLLLDNLPLIERIIRFACRRHRWSVEEAEEFAGAVRLKLIENDYDVLRRFQGRSSLSTYLTAVVLRFALDQHRRLAGRWRASTTAQALGPAAVRLEELLYRDGHTVEEAVEMMTSGDGTSSGQDGLRELATRIRPRLSLREESMAALPDVPAPQPVADDLVRRGELRGSGTRIAEALNEAVSALDADDRLILRLRYREGFQVAEIARTLGKSQKALYRRFDRLQAALRRALAKAGLLRPDHRELLEHPELLAEIRIFHPEGGNPERAPSNVDGESRRHAPPTRRDRRPTEEEQSPGGPHEG